MKKRGNLIYKKKSTCQTSVTYRNRKNNIISMFFHILKRKQKKRSKTQQWHIRGHVKSTKTLDKNKASRHLYQKRFVKIFRIKMDADDFIFGHYSL